MSIIFQNLVRDTGGSVPFDIGTGAPVSPTESQGLLLSATGAIFATTVGPIDYHYYGLPFDANGRLVLTVDGTVDSFDQGIPMTATGFIAVASSVVCPWILAAGMWNDLGCWDDSALWMDA